MRHIKSKRIFESSEITEDIKDICIDLEDEGFNISFLSGYPEIDVHNRLDINKCSHQGPYFKFFNYKEVEETINRLKDYLCDKFVSVYIKIDYKSRWNDINHQYFMNDPKSMTCIYGVRLNYLNGGRSRI